jgi:hypothetical protein
MLVGSLSIFMDTDNWSLVLYSVRTFHSVIGAKALFDIMRSMAEKELWAALCRVDLSKFSKIIW